AGTFHTPPCGRMSYPVLAPVSRGYPRVWGRLPTCYSPVRHSSTPPQGQSFSVRLACVKHAASVRPEPGSNSPTMPEFNPSKTNTHTTRHAHSLHSKKPPTLPNPTTGPESIRATNTSQTNPLLSSQRTHRKPMRSPLTDSTTLANPISGHFRGSPSPIPGENQKPRRHQQQNQIINTPPEAHQPPAAIPFSRGTPTTLAAPFSASRRGASPPRTPEPTTAAAAHPSQAGAPRKNSISQTLSRKPHHPVVFPEATARPETHLLIPARSALAQNNLHPHRTPPNTTPHKTTKHQVNDAIPTRIGFPAR